MAKKFENVMLFHWSPKSRRKQILRYGLCPNKLSRDKLWKTPFVCFAPSPSLAWGLSGALSRKNNEWDLWMVWLDRVQKTYEKLFDDRDNTVKEYRIYERLYKRDIWYVGTRKHIIRKRK
jgi:hypothetical protein